MIDVVKKLSPKTHWKQLLFVMFTMEIVEQIVCKQIPRRFEYILHQKTMHINSDWAEIGFMEKIHSEIFKTTNTL